MIGELGLGHALGQLHIEIAGGLEFAAHRRAVGRAKLGRRPNLHRIAEGKREPHGHDAENGVGMALNDESLADDVRIGRVELAPHIFPQQHHAIAPRFILFVAKSAPQNGLHTEHCGQARRYFVLFHLEASTRTHDANRRTEKRRADL